MNSNDMLARIIVLLEAMMTANKIAIPPLPQPKAASGVVDTKAQIETSRRNHEAFIARRRADLVPAGDDEFPESTIADIEQWRRRS